MERTAKANRGPPALSTSAGSGDVEMSWIPASSSMREEATAGKARKGKGPAKDIERFGAGLEKGGEEQRRLGELTENERRGRTERRRGIRSGSKNAIFGRT
jgi:ribosome biogenesis protein ENP2